MEKEIIVPGEKAGDDVDSFVFDSNGEKRSMILGMLIKDGEKNRIIPLKGKYLPEQDDYVIGIVSDVRYGGCSVELNSPYDAYLRTQAEYTFGDVIFAKIDQVSETKDIDLVDDRKLFGGEVIEVNPVKIPRIIGKKNSMITLIKEKTGCMIFVGRNGRIWLKGENAAKAKEAIRKIEAETHSSGLTEKISALLEKKVN